MLRLQGQETIGTKLLPPQQIIFLAFVSIWPVCYNEEFPWSCRNREKIPTLLRSVLGAHSRDSQISANWLLDSGDTSLWSEKSKSVKLKEDLQRNKNTPETYNKNKEIGEKLLDS